VRDNLEVKELTLARGSERRRFVLVRNPEQAAPAGRRRDPGQSRRAQGQGRPRASWK
jgi:hypothetical protein